MCTIKIILSIVRANASCLQLIKSHSFVQCSGDIIPGQDITWDQVMEKARPHDCVPVMSNDPLYILYTSGTTGDPKVQCMCLTV